MRFNQQTDLSSQRTFQKSVLGFFIAFICALFAAGCSSGGGGNDGFIASPGGAGGGGNNAGNGSVTFNFVRAQNAITVPLTTVNLRFEFFTGLEATGGVVLRETQPFAASVTINNVPSSARSSKVTAITAEGFPVAEFTTNVNVPAGQTVTVSSTDGTLAPITLSQASSSPSLVNVAVGNTVPITINLAFSNGENVALTGALASEVTFSSSDLNVATVDTSGNVTGILNGVSTISADINDYPGNTVNVTAQVGTGIVNPPIVTNLAITSPDGDPVSLPVGTQSSALTVTATFDTTGNQTVTAADGVVFTSDNANVSVNASQQIVVASGATAGETATITATFMGASDTVAVNVNAAILQTVTVNPSTVSLPFGGFEQALTITGNFSDGNTVNVDPAGMGVTFTENPTSNRYAVGGNVDAPAGTAAGTIVSAATDPGGTANPQTLNVVVNLPGQPQPVTGTVDVTVGAVTVNSLSINPSPVSLAPGQVQAFTVTANLSNSTAVDISNFDALTVTPIQAPGSADTDIVANGRQVVAVTPTPAGQTATARFGIAGFTQDVQVTVIQEFLTSVSYEFAGNPINNQTVNLPRGYVGLVECTGTFTSGAVRKLTFNEYTLERSADNSGDSDNMIHLWNSAFAISQPAARYQDNAPTGAATFDAVAATVDDLYFNIRQLAPVGAPHPTLGGTLRGSDMLAVGTRDTFRGVVADWPRGITDRSVASGTDFVDTTGNVSPGSVRGFTIRISPSIDNPTTPGSFDLPFTVTVTDPLQVSIDSAAFVNYAGEVATPTGTVRELDIRATFTAVDIDDTNDDGQNPGARGPLVNAFPNFKLAEANVVALSNVGGQNQFLFTTPTSLGGVGVSSDFPVDVNVLYLRVMPVGGIGVRPVATTVPVAPGGPGTYEAASYETVDRVFGAHTNVSLEENAGYIPSRDPGPVDDPSANSHLTRAPLDGVVITNREIPNAINFINPLLFSIDPINSGGALSLNLGQSQIFRTMVQFTGGTAPVERTLDYLPTLIAGTNPGVVGTRELATGRLTVSAVNTAGVDAMAADVQTITGYPNLAADADVAAALAQNVHGIVIALDAVGEPIVDRGTWANTVLDSLMQAGNAQSVSTVEAVATP